MPIIGIFPQYDMEQKRWFINAAYEAAVRKAGGYPILLLPEETSPLTGISEEEEPSWYPLADGFLFPGGPDVNPLHYHEDVQEGCRHICPERDYTELRALRYLIRRNKPVLGICRGIQMMNAALGGTLYQHFEETTISHYQQAPDAVPTHQVSVEPASRLRQITGCQILAVNSFHHQTVARIAENLVVSARTADGAVEALEAEAHPFYIGVQWHPEHLTRRSEEAALFRAFVEFAQRK